MGTIIKLEKVNTLIEKGEVGYYPLKALLMACDDFDSLEISDFNLFRDILKEGIEKGALSPDDEKGWSYLMLAAENNDPTEFMTDMDRYFDLLMTATEHGNQDAHEIMDMIWEPENCQEED